MHELVTEGIGLNSAVAESAWKKPAALEDWAGTLEDAALAARA